MAPALPIQTSGLGKISLTKGGRHREFKILLTNGKISLTEKKQQGPHHNMNEETGDSGDSNNHASYLDGLKLLKLCCGQKHTFDTHRVYFNYTDLLNKKTLDI